MIDADTLQEIETAIKIIQGSEREPETVSLQAVGARCESEGDGVPLGE